MNRILKYIVNIVLGSFGLIFGYLIPYRLVSIVKKLFRIFYTAWIGVEFKALGNGSLIDTGLNLVNGKYISIGEKTKIGKGTTMSAWDQYNNEIFTPIIVIGDHCNIGAGSHITAMNQIYIGNGVLTGKRITISDNAHGLSDFKQMSLKPIARSLVSKGPVIIENDVWIGEKACILPGVRIGQGSIIGANAVVVHDVPAYSVVVGIPGKVVKRLN